MMSEATYIVWALAAKTPVINRKNTLEAAI
jgi:hypothetical protein